MGLITFEFLAFSSLVLALYWLGRGTTWKNLVLLIGSGVFYGWLVPWHAAVLFLSILLDHGIVRGMRRWKSRAALLAWTGVLANLGLLAFVKYYASLAPVLSAWAGPRGGGFLAQVVLPLGLSFYVLKKVSYLADVYRGTIQPARDFIAYAAYVAFFPQVLSGPIDRPQVLLKQLEAPRPWKADHLGRAWPLLVSGLFKKIVIANPVMVIVDQVFLLEQPSRLLLVVGGLGYTVQILADFSSYTDLSRGLAYLLGLQTTENFNRPYLALTPSEFWNRWHITLSAWLRDYIFFPLRRALLRMRTLPEVLVQSIPPLATMFVSGVWHGVGSKFVVWGLYYGVLIVIYQLLGLRGDWRPDGRLRLSAAWLAMFLLIVFGWLIFRAPSLAWLWRVLAHAPLLTTAQEGITCLVLTVMTAFYGLLLGLKPLMDHFRPGHANLQALYYAGAALLVIVFVNSAPPDFIYFQF